MTCMRRRNFVILLGTSLAVPPLRAVAQQDGRVRQVGVLMNLGANDLEGSSNLAAFRQRLYELAWTEGQNFRTEYRWSTEGAVRARALAADLASLRPDVILVSGGTALSAILQETRSIPVVFVEAADPVELGVV